ncbi:MAG: PDZ domain-containing protein [Verrucomicrobia subdivision 3 bacterium]|nr:PDZ domain-containing protein [Limisphaerales bacterium]
MKVKAAIRAANASMWLNAGFVLAQAVPVDPITVPLFDDAVSCRVPVSVFDGTNFFLVDTGTSVTVVDARFRERLREPVRRFDGHDLYRSPNILLGQHALGLDEVICADLCMFRRIAGERSEGILGMDFLKDHVVEMDFERNRFSVSKTVREAAKQGARRVPMTPLNGRHFTIPAILNGHMSLNLQIDSGDSSTVSLIQSDWDMVFPPNGNPRTYRVLLAGIAKAPTGSRVARVQSLEVGGHVVSNVLCALRVFPGGSSSVGIGFLRRYLVSFDFPNRMLYLRPSREFNTKDEHDMSGLHLLRQEGAVVVHSVDEASPALLAGIKRGDVIVAINGRRCSEMKMKELRQILSAESGAKVSVETQRDGKTTRAEFFLKQFL